jgi:hypothetical protein
MVLATELTKHFEHVNKFANTILSIVSPSPTVTRCESPVSFITDSSLRWFTSAPRTYGMRLPYEHCKCACVILYLLEIEQCVHECLSHVLLYEQ